jgi:ABC-type transporter Mla subunit MlaD
MKTTLSMILVCALAVIPGIANANTTLAGQLTSEARELRAMADDLAKQLKNRRADVSIVGSRLDEFVRKSGEIRRLVAELDQSGLTLDASRQREFDRLKNLAATLDLFVTNKKELAEGGQAAQNREMLRAHTVGVATRAEMIEKTVRKLGM